MRALLLPLVMLTAACAGRATPPRDGAKPANGEASGQGSEGAAAREAPAPELPAGYIEMTVVGVRGTRAGNAVILIDRARTVAVPVFVGAPEAVSSELRRRGKKLERPLTHDLLDAMLARLDASLIAVRVDSIRDDVFIGTVLVRAGKRIEEFDSRVSDALALALGSRVPIWVSQHVVKKSGIDVRQLGLEPAETALQELR